MFDVNLLASLWMLVLGIITLSGALVVYYLKAAGRRG